MKTSADGRARIRQREGDILHAYRDTKGIWTIGTGHTGRVDGSPVASGMVITSLKSDQLLAGDLLVAEAAVNVSLPTGGIKQNQFDALVSLTFNIGVGAYSKSTVARRLKSGDVKGAGEAIMMWKIPKEIIGRRMTEYLQFISSEISVPSQPIPVSKQAVTETHAEALSFWTKVINFFRGRK